MDMFVLGANLCLCGGFEPNIGDLGGLLEGNHDGLVFPDDPPDDPDDPDDFVVAEGQPLVTQSEVILIFLVLFLSAIAIFSDFVVQDDYYESGFIALSLFASGVLSFLISIFLFANRFLI